MQLNSRQARVFRLANILGTGKPVAAAQIISSLECSEPTLTRVLKELRESYSAEIKYSKSTRSYQLVGPGLLDKKALKRMQEALASNAELKSSHGSSRVILAKDKKTAVSLSLRMTIVRKLDRLARLNGISRSESVEMLAEKYIDELIRDVNLRKKEK